MSAVYHMRVGPSAMVKELFRGVLRGYERNDLLTYASAIAFQVLFACVPLLLFMLGLAGLLGLEDVYERDLVPDLEGATSPAAFEVIDSTVRKVLGSKQTFWISAGTVITVWEMSGAVRGIMDVLDRVYCNEPCRSKRQRYVVSTLLSVGCGALLILVVAVHQLLPVLVGGAISWLRWPVSILLLTGVVGLLLHYAPCRARPWRWVSYGTGLTVVAWLGTSAVFGFYITEVAEYGSIFGNLATIIILFEYLYLAACAFLTGAQLDAEIQDRAGVLRSREPACAGS